MNCPTFVGRSGACAGLVVGPARVLLLGAMALCTADARAQTPPPPPISPAPVLGLEYDAQGNPRRQILAPGVPGLDLATSHQHDRLQRRAQTTDPRGGVLRMEYTGRDDLLRVTDPRTLLTQYPRNGLGDATGLVSPDTGSATHTYDAAGNLRNRQDSRGALATYSYDALNRLTRVDHTQSNQAPRVFAWLYDQTGPAFGFGIGRLTTAHHPSGFTTYGYDAQGRIVRSAQTVDAGAGAVTLGIGYGYDGAGRLTSVTYPSGRVLRIARNGGAPSGLTLAADASAAPDALLSAIQTEPAPGGEGPARAWRWHLASGTPWHERVFDSYGRLVRYPLGGALRDVQYDAADRIVAYRHLDALTGTATAAAQALDQTFGYDELGRLTSVVGSTASWTYGYDANGNRTASSVTVGTTTQSRSHQIDAQSNRLLALDNPQRTLTHDAAGNTASDRVTAGAAWATHHDASNRLAAVATWDAAGQRRDVSFGYDARALRVFKRPQSGTSVLYVHDLDGRLLGEYNAANGAVLREYVWLQGMPVAVIDGPPVAPAVHFVYTDHLDTPRVVIDRAGRQRWSWMAEPFGHALPIEDPLGIGAFRLNLRYPGQYFDGETGLVHNHHRDYDASVGRYTQSDPIGLQGGINTYTYAFGSPTDTTDPDGLAPPPPCRGTDCPEPPFRPGPDGPVPDPKPPSTPDSKAPNTKCKGMAKWLFKDCECPNISASHAACMSCCATVYGSLTSGGGTICPQRCHDKWPDEGGQRSCETSTRGSGPDWWR